MNRMLSLTLYWLLPAIMWVAGSCGSPAPTPEAKRTYFDAITGSVEGHFRGVQIGANSQQVVTAEKAEPMMQEEETYIVYEYPLTGKDFYSITYDLHENELYAIQVLVELESKEMAADLFKDYSALFAERYGDPSEADDFHSSWLFYSDQSEEIEVTLDDESLNADQPRLSIRFYDFDY